MHQPVIVGNYLVVIVHLFADVIVVLGGHRSARINLIYIIFLDPLGSLEKLLLFGRILCTDLFVQLLEAVRTNGQRLFGEAFRGELGKHLRLMNQIRNHK